MYYRCIFDAALFCRSKFLDKLFQSGEVRSYSQLLE